MLSGGQRKRASIAAELLTCPRALFLDEPTSGLDPATSAAVMRTLRGLAESGTTVVFTTHNTDDLAAADRVVFLAPGGCVSYVGTLEDALVRFGARRNADIYDRLVADTCTPWTEDVVERRLTPLTEVAPRIGPVQEWAVLSRRNVDVLTRNPLTLAILAGSPALVIAMFACSSSPTPSTPTPQRDRLLDGVRGVLLRPDLRPAADRHRDGRSFGGSGSSACASVRT